MTKEEVKIFDDSSQSVDQLCNLTAPVSAPPFISSNANGKYTEDLNSTPPEDAPSLNFVDKTPADETTPKTDSMQLFSPTPAKESDIHTVPNGISLCEGKPVVRLYADETPKRRGRPPAVPPPGRQIMFFDPAAYVKQNETLRLINPANEFSSDALSHIHRQSRPRQRRGKQAPQLNGNAVNPTANLMHVQPELPMPPETVGVKIVARHEFTVKMDHNEFKCEYENCTKTFRKQVLLEKHVEHYHLMKAPPPPTQPKPKIEKLKEAFIAPLSLAGYYIGDQAQVMPLGMDEKSNRNLHAISVTSTKLKLVHQHATDGASSTGVSSVHSGSSSGGNSVVNGGLTTPPPPTKSVAIAKTPESAGIHPPASLALFIPSNTGMRASDADESREATVSPPQPRGRGRPIGWRKKKALQEALIAPASTSAVAVPDNMPNSNATSTSTCLTPPPQIAASSSTPPPPADNEQKGLMMWQLRPPEPVPVPSMHQTSINISHLTPPIFPATNSSKIGINTTDGGKKRKKSLSSTVSSADDFSSTKKLTDKDKYRHFNLGPARVALQKRVAMRRAGLIPSPSASHSTPIAAAESMLRGAVRNFDPIRCDSVSEGVQDSLVHAALGAAPAECFDFDAVLTSTQPLHDLLYDRVDDENDDAESVGEEEEYAESEHPSDAEDVVRCACDDNIKVGRIVRCDLCQAWCHAHCMGISSGGDSGVPELFTCVHCLKPNAASRSGLDSRVFLQSRLFNFGEIPTLPEPHAYYQARHRAKLKGRPSYCDFTLTGAAQPEATMRERRKRNIAAAAAMVDERPSTSPTSGGPQSTTGSGQRSVEQQQHQQQQTHPTDSIDSVAYYLKLLGTIQKAKQLIAARRACLVGQWKCFEQQHQNQTLPIEKMVKRDAEPKVLSDTSLFSSFLNDVAKERKNRCVEAANTPLNTAADEIIDPARYNNVFSPTPDATAEQKPLALLQQADLERFLSRTHTMCSEVVDNVTEISQHITKALRLTAANEEKIHQKSDADMNGGRNSLSNGDAVRKRRRSGTYKKLLRAGADVELDMAALRDGWNKVRGSRLSRLRDTKVTDNKTLTPKNIAVTRKKQKMSGVKSATAKKESCYAAAVNGNCADSNNREEDRSASDADDENEEQHGPLRGPILLPAGRVISVAYNDSSEKSRRDADDDEALNNNDKNSKTALFPNAVALPESLCRVASLYAEKVQASNDVQLCKYLLSSGIACRLQPMGLQTAQQLQLQQQQPQIAVGLDTDLKQQSSTVCNVVQSDNFEAPNPLPMKLPAAEEPNAQFGPIFILAPPPHLNVAAVERNDDDTFETRRDVHEKHAVFQQLPNGSIVTRANIDEETIKNATDVAAAALDSPPPAVKSSRSKPKRRTPSNDSRRGPNGVPLTNKNLYFMKFLGGSKQNELFQPSHSHSSSSTSSSTTSVSSTHFLKPPVRAGQPHSPPSIRQPFLDAGAVHD